MLVAAAEKTEQRKSEETFLKAARDGNYETVTNLVVTDALFWTNPCYPPTMQTNYSYASVSDVLHSPLFLFLFFLQVKLVCKGLYCFPKNYFQGLIRKEFYIIIFRLF